MKIINKYICDICGDVYDSENKALECESLPKKDITLEIPDDILTYTAYVTAHEPDNPLVNFPHIIRESGKILNRGEYVHNIVDNIHQEAIRVEIEVNGRILNRLVVQDYKDNKLFSNNELLRLPK